MAARRANLSPEVKAVEGVSDDSSDCDSDSELVVRRERAQRRRNQKDANDASA
jgi:hypothetical protein